MGTDAQLQCRRKKWLKRVMTRKQFSRGFIRLGRHMDPLGVACEIYRQETGKGEWVKYKPGEYAFMMSEREYFMYMPQQVSDYFGFISQKGHFRGSYLTLCHICDVRSEARVKAYIKTNHQRLFRQERKRPWSTY